VPLLAADPRAVVLLDATLCGVGCFAQIAAALVATPSLRIAGYVPDDAKGSVAAGVRLYNAGVRPVVTAGAPDQWAAVRTLFDREPGLSAAVDAEGFEALVHARFRYATAPVRRAIAVVLSATPPTDTATLAQRLGVPKASVVSAFFRESYASPSTLLRSWWLLQARRAAAADPALPIAELASAAAYSSVPTFCRAIKQEFRVDSVGDWIAQYSVEALEQWFLARCPAGEPVAHIAKPTRNRAA
jgi:AraC-like DNA-binding protein